MVLRPPSQLALLALLCAVAAAPAEESARDARDAVLGDLVALRDAATDPPALSHMRNAVSFLERTLDQFADADHILDPPQALDNLRQTIDSCTVAAEEALGAGGNRGLADLLKADATRLAQAARRLAGVLVADRQGISWIIDSESASANAAALDTAQAEIARGDALLAVVPPEMI